MEARMVVLMAVSVGAAVTVTAMTVLGVMLDAVVVLEANEIEKAV